MADPVPHLTPRLWDHTSTIFTEMSALAMANGAVNLGQGAPDFSGPGEVLDAAVAAIRGGANQYAPGHGIRPLREAIAAHQQRRYGLRWDPDDEVTVTAGATEGIWSAVTGLVEPGDEVIAFAPWYDSYAAVVAMAGGRLVGVPLPPPDRRVDVAALQAAVTPATRAIIVNTPHNPTGRVLDRDELQAIADVVIGHDLVAITDEVYEHLTFDGAEHVPLATLEGMRERTISISSAGKTFSVTGWKVGWACASRDLTPVVRTPKQWSTFCNGTPFQFAVKAGLELPDEWFDDYRRDYAIRRDRLCAGLEKAGFEVAWPQGTYFALLDARQLGADDGLDLCRRLPAEGGVAAIPVRVFHADRDRDRTWLRLAFCKDLEAIDEGVARLAAWRDQHA